MKNKVAKGNWSSIIRPLHYNPLLIDSIRQVDKYVSIEHVAGDFSTFTHVATPFTKIQPSEGASVTGTFHQHPSMDWPNEGTHRICGVISKASGLMPMGQMLTVMKRPLYSMRLGYDSSPRILRVASNMHKPIIDVDHP